jgi:hypothetical protein
MLGQTMPLFPIVWSSPHAVSDAPDATLVASRWSNDWHPLTMLSFRLFLLAFPAFYEGLLDSQLVEHSRHHEVNQI